jgi:hypothetical protein
MSKPARILMGSSTSGAGQDSALGLGNSLGVRRVARRELQGWESLDRRQEFSMIGWEEVG